MEEGRVWGEKVCGDLKIKIKKKKRGLFETREWDTGPPLRRESGVKRGPPRVLTPSSPRPCRYVARDREDWSPPGEGRDGVESPGGWEWETSDGKGIGTAVMGKGWSGADSRTEALDSRK